MAGFFSGEGGGELVNGFLEELWLRSEVARSSIAISELLSVSRLWRPDISDCRIAETESRSAYFSGFLRRSSNMISGRPTKLQKRPD